MIHFCSRKCWFLVECKEVSMMIDLPIDIVYWTKSVGKGWWGVDFEVKQSKWLKFFFALEGRVWHFWAHMYSVVSIGHSFYPILNSKCWLFYLTNDLPFWAEWFLFKFESWITNRVLSWGLCTRGAGSAMSYNTEWSWIHYTEGSVEWRRMSPRI